MNWVAERLVIRSRRRNDFGVAHLLFRLASASPGPVVMALDVEMSDSVAGVVYTFREFRPVGELVVTGTGLPVDVTIEYAALEGAE